MSEHNKVDTQLKIMCKIINRLQMESGMTLEAVASSTGIPMYILRGIAECYVTDSFTVDMLLALCTLYHLYPSDFFSMSTKPPTVT